jgi:hypothetical protein
VQVVTKEELEGLRERELMSSCAVRRRGRAWMAGVKAQTKGKSTSGWEWVVRSDERQGFVSRALLTSASRSGFFV